MSPNMEKIKELDYPAVIITAPEKKLILYQEILHQN